MLEGSLQQSPTLSLVPLRGQRFPLFGISFQIEQRLGYDFVVPAESQQKLVSRFTNCEMTRASTLAGGEGIREAADTFRYRGRRPWSSLLKIRPAVRTLEIAGNWNTCGGEQSWREMQKTEGIFRNTLPGIAGSANE
jgi:hypothetical protein